MTIAQNDDEPLYQSIEDEQAAIAEMNEQAAFDAKLRKDRAEAELKAGLYAPDMELRSVHEQQRLARAEAFAATPQGRRLLAARARAA